MNLWHAFTDSDAFRSFRKRGPGRPIFRSRTFQRMNLWRYYGMSALVARRDSGCFRHIRAFCFFVGHNKSGTSLLGALLDAHPKVILADEIGALRYVEAGFSRDQLFYLLLRGSRVEARKGRVTAHRLEPYSYWVPEGWQGRCSAPLVIGDSTSGSSTRLLGLRPDLLDRLSGLLRGIEPRLIQVIRNPFDPISVGMVRGGRSFQNAIDRYFIACETLVEIRRRVDPGSLLPVRYETFVAGPEQGLARVCRFLGVDVDQGYLRACGRIVRRRPDRSREMVKWTQPWIDDVERRIASFDFLQGYSYEN
jgi:hypothetical protein